MLPMTTLNTITINNINCGQLSPNGQMLQQFNLHPITVEFDRLLRRQQQLSSTTTSKTNLSSKTNSKNAHSSSWSTRSSASSSSNYSTILDDCADVHQLLYSTLIHYQASLSSTNENDNEFMEKDMIQNIYRTLCTPGTRTLLLLAEKNDIFQYIKQCSIKDNSSLGQDDEEMLDDEDEFDDGQTNALSSCGMASPSTTPITATTTSTDDCISQADDPRENLNENPSNKPTFTTRTDKLKYLIDPKFNDFKLIETGNHKQPNKSGSKKINKFFQDFDHYVDNALQRKHQLFQWAFNNKSDKLDQDDQTSLASGQSIDVSMIGLEQQIIGAVTFYKSYRLESVKIMEIALLAVQPTFQNLGIGTQLIKLLKENSQIGPYDSMHVQVPTGNPKLIQFFLKNEFSDDLILNAGFEQLIIRSDGEDGSDLDDFDQDDNVQNNDQQDDSQEDDDDISHCSSFTNASQATARIHHSSSYGQISMTKLNNPRNHFRQRLKNKRNNRMNKLSWNTRQRLQTGNNASISMCYLPPFSVGTLSESMSASSIPNHRRTLEKLDNKFVDDIIEQANMVWRRDLLASYRTQWSCVARLRSEITRLRQQLTRSDQTIEQLRRENFQLRNALVYKNRSTLNKNNNVTSNQNLATNLQKQLLLYSRNFCLDNSSLDF